MDGSENFRRGIELTAFSVAVLPAGIPLAPAEMVAGVLGNVFTGTRDRADAPSPRALVGLECELAHPALPARVGRVREVTRSVPSVR